MKTHKILVLILCLIMLAQPLITVWAQEQTDVIRISSLEEFLFFADNCELDSYSMDQHFLLTCDIDLTGTDFDGIPIFCGTFDGGYHTITGLDIRSAGSQKGLFRILAATGTIKNLHVSGSVQPQGSREKVGGIVGVNAGLILECTFQGTVIASSYAGGIVGINEASGRIQACSVSGSVSAYHFSGGVTGSNAGTIDDCHNQASVNTTAQQNQIHISDINLGNLTNTESASATTDIGGITGMNSGTILGCSNRGNIGYKHMGYNVGGIAGLQTGYVAGCENYGAISGRKEVGGIIGQQEPQVLLRYDTDTLQILKAQFVVLSDLMDRVSANTNTNAANIRNLLHQIETHISNAEDAMAILQAGLEAPKFEDLQTYLDAFQTIRDSIDGIESCLRKLWAALDETSTDLNQDMEAISDQLAVIEQTLNNAEEHLGGQILDISDQDTAEDWISKVEQCTNHGPILGDLHAGGIVGAIVFENDMDPEEDISVVGDATLNVIGSLRSVIRDCSNTGTVAAKNQRIGGIAGWISMGLIRDCSNSGNINNITADYVGGIVGQSAGFIRNCKVKSSVSGKTNVGGIAGSGAIVSDCYAMVQLSATEKFGSILGSVQENNHDMQEPITANLYLQFAMSPGGIDGISYEGKAHGLRQDDFFLLTQDPMFDQVTIRFIADGEVILSVTQNAGSSFTAIPMIPAKDGFTGYWEACEMQNWDCILFDVTIYGTYVAFSGVIQSQETDGQGRPILLLQGDFSIDATATLTQLQNFTALQRDQTLLQSWQLETEGCMALQGGRLLIPAGQNMKHVVLLVRDSNGNWSERVYKTVGSYIVFSLTDGEDAIALVENPHKAFLSAEMLIAGATGAAFVMLVLVVFLLLKRRRKKPEDPA